MKKRFVLFAVLLCMLINLPALASFPEFTDYPSSTQGFSYYMIIKYDVSHSPSDGWYLLYIEDIYGLILNWNDCLVTPNAVLNNYTESQKASYLEKFPNATKSTNSRIEKWELTNSTDGNWVFKGVQEQGFYGLEVGGMEIKLSGYGASLYYHNFDLPIMLYSGSWDGDGYPANPIKITVREVVRQSIPVLPKTILKVGSVVLPRACLILAILLAVFLIPRFLRSWAR